MPAITDQNSFGEIGLFRGLTLDQLSKLNESFHCKTLSQGTRFITVEEPGEAIYVITDGAVKVFNVDEAGDEVILAILTAGEVIGEMSLLDCAWHSANAIALEKTTVFWMNRASFQECLRTMPIIQRNLLRLLCNRLRAANERIQSFAVQDVEGRVARQLLAFADLYCRNGDEGIVIPFRLTQGDLANLVGATRVRVNQVISTYKQRKYITVDQDYRITIHNREALSRRAHHPLSRLAA